MKTGLFLNAPFERKARFAFRQPEIVKSFSLFPALLTKDVFGDTINMYGVF